MPSDVSSPETGSPVPVDPQGTEDAPTVLSKAHPSRGEAEDRFAGLLRGRRLAHFELEEAIGVGGMAAVVRARDTQLDRRVALKILPPEMATDPENVRRFQQEARAAAKLDHENIARVFYCGEDQGLHFIAFEFVEGQNLRTMIAQRGRIPVAEAIHYVLQVTVGLAHAAARGVVHRDIKPSNIIVGEHGRAKLVDMGLARNLDTPAGKELTQSGVTLGTFDYISPEQALEPRSADVRSDIYSLGCTLYHMLTGQPPVPGGTAARKLQFHQHGAPVDPRQLNPDIPDEVAAILAKMMAKDPKDRYQRAEHLVQHLLAVYQKLTGQTTPLPPNEVLFVDSILPSRPRTRPLAVLAAAGLAVVLLVGLLGTFSDSGPTGAAPRPYAGPPKDEQSEVEPVSLPPPLVTHARSVQQLREAISQGTTTKVTLEPGAIYELATDGALAPEQTPALIFARGNLTIEASKPASQRPVIRLSYRPADPFPREWAALKLLGGTVTFKGVRFEIDARAATSVLPMAIFAVQGGQLILEQCEFVQRGVKEPSGEEVRLTVLRVVPGPAEASAPAQVTFKGCYFAGGQKALTLEEGAWVKIQDCLFAPYQQPIHLTGKAPPRWLASVTATDSSWLIDSESVIRIDNQRACTVETNRCIFSYPGGEEIPAAPHPALLLLEHSGLLEKCKYTGTTNYYHNLSSLIAVINQKGEWQPLIERPGPLEKHPAVQDSASRWQTENPWAVPNPLQVLASLGMEAFRVNMTLPGLLEGGRPLGAQFALGRPLYPNSAPPAPTPGIAPDLRPPIKDQPLIVERSGPYTSLGSALGAAASSEEVIIELKVNGILFEMPLDIRKHKKVTIRAAQGYQPVIALVPTVVPEEEGKVTLFRVHDEELVLENLEFRLQPLAAKTTTLESVVTITGSGRCTFDHCLATLEGSPDGDPRLTLISVADQTRAMLSMDRRSPQADTPPVMKLVDCLVRGRGELVTVRASRPYDLQAKNSLVVLAGSLLSVEGNKPDAGISGGATVSFEHLTTYLTQHLVQLRAGEANNLHVPLTLAAQNCILASADGSPLLALDGPENDRDLKGRLSWRGRQNVYMTAGPLLLCQPVGTRMMDQRMPRYYDRFQWVSLWGPDDEQPYFSNNLLFRGAPSAERLAQALPADFTITPTELPEGPNLTTRGANLNRLPQPASDTTTEEANP